MMKVAIWGAGKMGGVHAKAYRKLANGVEIAAVIEADREKGQKFSDEFNCRICENISDLAQGEVDAIDICLPTFEHRTAIIKALDICAYILCEKPVCLYESEYGELKKEVEKRGGSVMVGQVLRFWNGYEKIRELVINGAVGTPRLVTCTRRQKMPEWSNGNWLMDPGKSGGILMDVCIHDVDYVKWVLGMPSRVVCEAIKGEEEKSLHNIVVMSYDGCSALVIGSWGMPQGFNGGELSSGLEIVGDTGMITYRGGDHIEMIAGKEKQEILLASEDGYEQEIRYFVNCFKENKIPSRSGMDAVEGTMEILWAAKLSCETNKAICL